MNVTQQQVVITAARQCINTSFHHQGRQPGIGLDCIGLIVVAMQAAGYAIDDRRDYSKRPDGHSLIKAITDHGGVKVDKCEAGDILVFRYDRQPQHVALATSATTMIHSFAPVGKVVETSIGDYWKRRLVGIYRFQEE